MASAKSGTTERAKKANRGAFLGFLIDNFDIYLPVVALAPAIGYFIPADMPLATAALVSSWIFVATLIGRPLGSLIFGTLGDAIGRRRATLIAVSGFGVVTLLIGLLPGYATWGTGSVVALVALRFVDGVFLGGEYSGANVLAMEESPKERRGPAGGLIQTGATIAFVLMSVLTLGVFQIAAPGPAGDAVSAYSQWGWRIPFFIGTLLAIAFVFYYRREVSESSVWQKAPANRLSALSLLRGRNLKVFVQVFALMTGLWFLLNSVTALLPGVLAARVGLAPTQITTILVITYAVITAVYIGGGYLSQRVGRRPYFVATGIGAIVLGIPSYALLITATGGSFWVFAALAGAFIIAPWATITPYLSERFRTENRAAGFGLGYSLAVIIPAFYASYQLGLANLLPAEFTVLVLVAIGAILVVVAALAGPETKDVDFHAEVAEHDAVPTGVSPIREELA